MREKILEMVSLLVAPFDKTVDGVSFVDGFEDVAEDLQPEEIRNLVAFIKAKLRENRAGYEDAVVNVISKYLDEGDVDAVLAYNKSASGSKLRDLNAKIQLDLNEATGKWRNSTLEPHIGEVKQILGATEPAPIEVTDEPKTEPTTEPAP